MLPSGSRTSSSKKNLFRREPGEVFQRAAKPFRLRPFPVARLACGHFVLESPPVFGRDRLRFGMPSGDPLQVTVRGEGSKLGPAPVAHDQVLVGHGPRHHGCPGHRHVSGVAPRIRHRMGLANDHARHGVPHRKGLVRPRRAPARPGSSRTPDCRDRRPRSLRRRWTIPAPGPRSIHRRRPRWAESSPRRPRRRCRSAGMIRGVVRRERRHRRRRQGRGAMRSDVSTQKTVYCTLHNVMFLLHCLLSCGAVRRRCRAARPHFVAARPAPYLSRHGFLSK